ncbi:hypothetical protein CEXT_262021 [Caerostris extrusa]|uniref:Uncharacterized protein n=1 Tax=Caerostris extrusa TaxID=172846 RepID=A0AAV4XTW3_CAEEX|nr:hypothetical protein CEXT_262021 [Caerostris extrusa]
MNAYRLLITSQQQKNVTNPIVGGRTGFQIFDKLLEKKHSPLCQGCVLFVSHKLQLSGTDPSYAACGGELQMRIMRNTTSIS